MAHENEFIRDAKINFSRGRIVEWNKEKKWGFLQNHTQQRVFVHQNQCNFKPEEGNLVEYFIERQPETGKFRACAVKRQTKQLHGKIIQFSNYFGWGMIRRLDKGGDVFVHKNHAPWIAEGMEVVFDVGEDYRGLCFFFISVLSTSLCFVFCRKKNKYGFQKVSLSFFLEIVKNILERNSFGFF